MAILVFDIVLPAKAFANVSTSERNDNSSDHKVNFEKAWYCGVNNVVASYGAAKNIDISRGLGIC